MLIVSTNNLPCLWLSPSRLTAKNFFRVSYRSGGQLQSHCFQASDAFNKQQWINCIRQAKEAAALSPETGGYLEKGSAETGLSSHCDSGLEDEKGTWGEGEPRLHSEEEVAQSGDLSVGKKAGEMDGEIETGLGVGGGMGFQFDEETGLDGETKPVISETETEMETGQGVCEVAAEPGAKADWEIQGEGSWRGDTLSEGANDVPATSLCGEEEEEKGLMEEERSRADEGEEAGMETSEDDSLQCEELSHRC